MKHYVIQRRNHDWDPWEVCKGRGEFATLKEAKAAFDALPFKENYRIAESYIQVRYKPIKV